MKIDRSKILKDLFEYFPELQEVWVDGNLEHFSNALLIVDDCVDVKLVWDYFLDTYNLYDDESGFTIVQKHLYGEIESDYTHYTREEC